VPYLILSDIHANMEALEAVLKSAAGRYDRILCLGDIVGYGADPNEAVEWVRRNAHAVIRGNHDRGAVWPETARDFSPHAGISALWTAAALHDESRDYLRTLPGGPLCCDGFALSHGSPRDEDEYVATVAEASQLRPFLEKSLTLFGHTHKQGGFLLARSGVKAIARDRTLELEPDYVYLVNPGSVGQPRDGDPRAAYAIYSPEECAVEFHRAAYDVDRAAAKIRSAGLPDMLASRLYVGA
jgi:predicted phosphodiesterase